VASKNVDKGIRQLGSLPSEEGLALRAESAELPDVALFSLLLLSFPSSGARAKRISVFFVRVRRFSAGSRKSNEIVANRQ